MSYLPPFAVLVGSARLAIDLQIVGRVTLTRPFLRSHRGILAMGFDVKILADSVNLAGNRLVTFELKYPRFIHAELLTHRMMSRNSASSRAIPIEKMLERIVNDPVVPIHWGKNQKGMQADVEINAEEQKLAEEQWLLARNACVRHAQELTALGIHKQIVNRIVEPWMWITVIASMTSFEHFRRLRVHPAAEPHFQKLAGMMATAYDSSTPELLKPGEWHLPLIKKETTLEQDGLWFGNPDNELSEMDAVKVSTGRCARVSYLTHHGTRDESADIKLHDDLCNNGHWSPFEHPARATAGNERYGNYTGFIPYRKLFKDEFIPDVKAR
jgi:thymidylate synthase ThyX